MEAGVQDAQGWVVPVLVVLVGGAVGKYYDVQREKRAAIAETQDRWREANEPSYRTFLRAWGGATAPSILERAFAQLQANADVPRELVQAYRATLKVLESTADAGRKGEAADELHEEIARIRADPPTPGTKARRWRSAS